MVKLKKPVLCEVDENYFVSAADNAYGNRNPPASRW